MAAKLGLKREVVLDGENSAVQDIVLIARRQAQVRIPAPAWDRVKGSRAVVESVLRRGDPVYGLNTGVGSLKRFSVSEDNLEHFNMQVVASHAAPITAGELPTEVVRAMMAARINGMLRGGCGVRVELVQLLVDMLNRNVHPVVHPLSVSVGQSDLSPLAEVGQVLVGHGECDIRGERMSGAQALDRAGLTPLRLQAKEGLGLISANAMTLGQGSLLLWDTRHLLNCFDIAGALALEGFAGNLSIIDSAVAAARPFPGQLKRIQYLQALLDGSYLWNQGAARNLQDPLSFRCIPQVHGACDDALRFAEDVVVQELNSAEDNPLVIPEQDIILSNGNFDTTITAMAFDLLRIALGRLVVMATQRIHKQIWSEFSGLNAALATQDGADKGMHMYSLARVAAALAAEAHYLSHPASLTFDPQLTDGIEDHASMAPLSLSRTEELLRIGHSIVALELVVSTKAIRRRNPNRQGRGTRRAFDLVRATRVIRQRGDEEDLDLTQLVDAVASGKLVEAVDGASA